MGRVENTPVYVNGPATARGEDGPEMTDNPGHLCTRNHSGSANRARTEAGKRLEAPSRLNPQRKWEDGTPSQIQ